MDLKTIHTNKRKPPVDTMIYGKVPPQAKEFEESILGAIMVQKNAYDDIADMLRPEMFYVDSHARIFTAIQSLARKSQPIDIQTVCEELRHSGELETVGGMFAVTKLTQTVVSSAHIQHHARIVIEKFFSREQIRIGGEMISNAYEDSVDPFENLEQAQRDLHELSTVVNHGEADRLDSVMVDVFQNIEKLRHRENFLIGVTSGYPSIDKLTFGWRETDLNIIAARPAVGKTAFTLSLAIHAAMNNQPAAFFSLEMGRRQLVERILASQARMFLSTIKGARLSDEQMQHLYTKGLQPLAGVPLFIDDTASLTVGQFKAKLRRLQKKYGIKIAFVDYLQLMKSSIGKNANRQQQIGDISRELKITAKELDMPIIALSQLSREIEKRASPIPQLSDLREAGDIEQDADMVAFLYGHLEKDLKADMNLENEIFLKIAKHRNGALANLKFEYNKSYQFFTDQGEGEIKFTSTKGRKEDDPF